MSAWIVDPRTIDYLVQWAQRHRHDHSGGIRTGKVWERYADVWDTAPLLEALPPAWAHTPPKLPPFTIADPADQRVLSRRPSTDTAGDEHGQDAPLPERERRKLM